MKASKFTEAQIAFVLKQAADGAPVGDVCRKAGIPDATFYNWCKKYACLMPGYDHQLSVIRATQIVKASLNANFRRWHADDFISRDFNLWAYQKGVTLDFSRPGKPTDNSYIESFNGKFRAECLNTQCFMCLDDAAQRWRVGLEIFMKRGIRQETEFQPDFRFLQVRTGELRRYHRQPSSSAL